MNFDKIKAFFKSKKFKKALTAVVAYALALVLMAFVGVVSVSSAIKKRVDDRIVSSEAAKEVYGVDCIVVLGAFVKVDGNPSDMLRDRLDTALELYRAGVSEKILVSGDHGSVGYNEVGIMKKYLVDNGVPEENVFMDHAGFSTYESMCRTKDVFLTESYYKRVIVVTQEYHLYRALYIAEQIGVDAYGVPADLHTYRGQLYRDAREVLARFKDYFSCYLSVKPTYLGEPISIYGDGNFTNDSYYEALFTGEEG